MHIQSLPMWVGSSNNYAYLVTDEASKDSVIIDPANPPEVTPTLHSQTASGAIHLTAILNTHHHGDHAGGNRTILQQFPSLPILGGTDCEAVTRTPAHGSRFTLGQHITVTALHTPCHTQDSICWYMEDNGDGSSSSSSPPQQLPQRAVFTGDTLFTAGCGRFFEGTAAEMHAALNQVLAALPDDTKIYPGHEYTKANVRFAMGVSQREPVTRLQQFAEENQETQGRFTMAEEKEHNLFMRVHTEEMRKATGEEEPSRVMARLREMKNSM